MKESLLDKFMSRKGLYTAFWIIALIMVTMLIRYTANLQKEVPPIPKEVKSVSGEVLYTYDDVVAGKGYFQQFDLTDWGSLLGMGAYMGPDFSTDFLHYRALYLYDYYGKELYLKDALLADSYTDAEKIGYTPEQIQWSQENEGFIWEYFVSKEMLYSTNPKLPNQFINLAPFSKFYLEIDNESPGRIGRWVGWQMVRSFMENNEKVSLQDMLKMDAKQIFEQSKYKPKRNE